MPAVCCSVVCASSTSAGLNSYILLSDPNVAELCCNISAYHITAHSSRLSSQSPSNAPVINARSWSTNASCIRGQKDNAQMWSSLGNLLPLAHSRYACLEWFVILKPICMFYFTHFHVHFPLMFHYLISMIHSNSAQHVKAKLHEATGLYSSVHLSLWTSRAVWQY